MNVCFIIDPDKCVYDAYIYDPRSLALRCMYVYMILNPEACIHCACIEDACIQGAWIHYAYIYDPLCLNIGPDACMYDAYIYDLRPLTLMHVCMIYISMIIDTEPCVYDA